MAPRLRHRRQPGARDTIPAPATPKALSDLNLQEIAARLQESRSHAPPGGYAAHSVEDIILALSAGTEFPHDLHNEERVGICQTAVFSLAKDPALITRDRLLSAVQDARRAFLAKPTTPFVLATSLVMRNCPGLSRARLFSHTIMMSNSLPRHIDRSHVQESRDTHVAKDDDRFLKVRVHVRARSSFGAYATAMDTLDFMRGAWNFSLNRGLLRAWSSNETKPLNQILPGPVHTLHHSNGRRATDSFWYEPFFAAPTFLPDFRHKWNGVRSDWTSIRRALRRSPYGDQLRQALMRYCRALDIRDPDHAFLKLWSLLELLTNTGNDGYSTTIRRILFLYEDPFLERCTLEVLRSHRNRAVHTGYDGIGRKNLVRLHRYVVDLLMFALHGHRFFRSLAELGEFLSLSPEREVLHRKSQLVREGLKFKRLA